MAGRHRKPTNTARNFQRAALLTAGAGAPLAFASVAMADEIVVQPGDTLSEIAIEKLGMPEWQTFYRDNEDVVGANPDLIFPGQTLSFPGGLYLPTPPEPIPAPVDPAPEVVEGPVGEEKVVDDVAPELQAGVSAFINNSAGPVSAAAQRAADLVFSNVRGASLIDIGGTRASARDMHGHPSGNALDFMVLGDSALGDAIVSYHVQNWDELGVEYVIWQQRILMTPGGSWEWMEDRGSATQNHYDHVHVNYRG